MRRVFSRTAVVLLVAAWAVALASPAEARRTVSRLPASVAQGRLTARAAFLVDHHTGEVLFERNPDERLPPASTTKVLTAIVALRSGQLDQSAVVSAYASEMQPSKIYLRPGWSLSIADLVYAILLNSANDASVVIAEGLAGSVPAFARQMNATAIQIGALHSHFVNPNGLPDLDHYSTARDLVRIMRHGMQYPELRDILSTPRTVIRPTAGSVRPIMLRSHNRLLGTPGMQVIGKTGFTREAKRCFVGAARAGDREIVFSVLGATDLWGDLRRLIDFGFHRGNPAYQMALWQPPPPPDETAASQGDEGNRGYHLRLGTFRSRASADRLRQRVAGQGYKAVVEEVGARKAAYRVVVRGFESHGSAARAARAIGKSCGVKPQVIAVGT